MKHQKSKSFTGAERLNRRRFVKHVAVGTVMAFGMGLATSAYAITIGSGPYNPDPYPDPYEDYPWLNPYQTYLV